MGKWISVKDRLPVENECVLIWCGGYHVAKIEKGITEEERELMKCGKLPDPTETMWSASTGYVQKKRSDIFKSCDVFGNNKVPYCWYANGGPMRWRGQDVTLWRPLPEPPSTPSSIDGW